MSLKIRKPLKWYYIVGWEINYHFDFAEKWNDLTDWQIRILGRFLFKHRDEEVENKFLRNLIVVILAIPRPTPKAICMAAILFYYRPMSQLRPKAEFILDESNNLTRFPEAIKIGRWPFNRKKVFGPATRLVNVTIEELSFADTYFYKWETDRNVMDLHRLAAILFRPNGTGATPEDIRAPFSKLLLEKNAKITDAIPLHVKYMIAKSYKGCRNNFIDKHPHVFPKPKTDEGAEQKKRKPYQPFSKIIDSFAMDDTQIFGPKQKVEKVFAPDFFGVFEESIKREQEKQRQQDLFNHKNSR